MAQIIGLPKLSPTMEEGVLVKWSKGEGDRVSPGDLVAEVETDKANMDFNIEDEGVLLKLLVKEGDTVKLGAPVAIIGEAGEDISALVQEAKGQMSGGAPAPAAKAEAPAPAPVSAQAPAAAQVPAVQGSPAAAPAQPAVAAAPAPAPAPKPAAAAPAPAAPAAQSGGKVLASPLAKSLAIELGVDLRTVTGTGPGGRIVERDVRSAAAGGAQAPAATAAVAAAAPVAEAVAPPPAPGLPVKAVPAAPASDADFTDQPLSNMRKRIAQRLSEAKRDIPHFYLQRSFDIGPLMGFRKKLNDLAAKSAEKRGTPAVKVSVNDLIIKGVALALRRVPECNGAFMGESIRYFHRVHVGVAVAIDQGLVTPVIRDADQKGIGVIAAEVRDLATRARERKLKGDEITGSTFTVSNLGMFGIESFSAIINPPEAGILAVGTVVEQPVVKNGAIEIGQRMTMTLSCDHRVIDGALGARLLDELVDLLEKPESLAL